MIHQDDIRSAECMTTLDLVRWAAQVATGMEFLGKKKVSFNNIITLKFIGMGIDGLGGLMIAAVRGRLSMVIWPPEMCYSHRRKLSK